jgi:hypothetical protein
VTQQTAVLRAMVAQYSAELANAWPRGLSPRQVQRLMFALAGALECLSLIEQGPRRRRRARADDMLTRPMQWALAQ